MHAKGNVADDLKIGVPTLELIVDAFRRPVRDLRDDFNEPIFRKSVLSMADLRRGAILTGRVTNVVSFGVFVDVGVETSGLVHVSSLRGAQLHYGDQVRVEVDKVELDRKRIGLLLA